MPLLAEAMGHVISGSYNRPPPDVPRPPDVVLRRGARYRPAVFFWAGAVVADAAFDIGGLLAVAVANGLSLSVAASATMNVPGVHINP